MSDLNVLKSAYFILHYCTQEFCMIHKDEYLAIMVLYVQSPLNQEVRIHFNDNLACFVWNVWKMRHVAVFLAHILTVASRNMEVFLNSLLPGRFDWNFK